MVVLLVDDERVELDMLEHCVEWDSLGVEKVYTAGNGRRALQIVQDRKPDIVITDIEMPVMDGITLSRKIRAMGLNIKIIYLTGYDNFAYIKAAFKMDAVDYILKPVVPAVVKDVIGRSAALIKKEKEAEQSFEISRHAMMEELVLRGREEKKTAVKLGDKLSGSFTMLQIYGGMNKVSCEKICSRFPEICYEIWERDKTTFLLKPSKKTETMAAEILAEGKKDSSQILNSIYIKEPIDIQHLHEAYQVSCSYHTQLYYKADGVIVSAERADIADTMTREPKPGKTGAMQDVYMETVRRYQEGIPDAEENRIYEITRNLFDSLDAYRCEVEEAVRYLCALVWELDCHFVRGNDRISQFMALNAETAIEKIGESLHSLEAEQILTTYLHQICSYFEMQRQGRNSYVVLKVKEYIKNNYQGQISMEKLGTRLNLSPNYIRAIFKAETGQTILEYIMDYRFSTACSLLKDKNLKVREVSRQVGYDNVSYFCSVFTKRYGVSPSEYRNSL